MPLPKISVITPTYNAGQNIERAIISIVNQQYPAIEHIIVDGVSNDQTISIVNGLIKKYNHLKLFSGKDDGVYDAMNRGMNKSEGDWLYFMGADDELFDSQTLHDLVRAGAFDKERIVYGNVFVSGDTSWAKDKSTYDGPFTMEKLLRKNICHQSIFYPRSVIGKIGYFNKKYSITADWDYNIRCFRWYEFYHVDRIIATFRGGGKSSDKRDDSINADFSQNLVNYFQLNPWGEENYDINSPFYYHMSRIRENSYELTVTELRQEIQTMNQAISSLTNSHEAAMGKLQAAFDNSLSILSKANDHAIDLLKKEHNEKLHMQQNLHEEIVRNISNNLNELKTQLTRKEQEYQESLNAKKDEYDKLQFEHQSLVGAYNASSLDHERYLVDQKNLVNSLNETIEAQKIYIRQQIDQNEKNAGILISIISEKESVIETTKKSYTWKVGKFILAPFQFFLRQLRKR